MKKKFFLTALTLCAVICLGLGLTACGKGSNDKVTATNGLVYKLNKDKTSYNLIDYDESVGQQSSDIVIANEINGKPVVAVQNAIFYDQVNKVGNDNIKTLTIPDNVAKITETSFWGLSALEVVNIGSGLKTIEDVISYYVDKDNLAGIFLGCDNITQFNVSLNNTNYRSEGACLIEKAGVSSGERKGGSVNQYDKLIYSGKGNVIPESVGIIGKYCFLNRKTALSSTIPSQIKQIDEYAFAFSQMNGTLNLHEGIVEIGNNAFDGVKGISGDLVIPNSLKRVRTSAFKDLNNLSSITIGDGTEYIESHAFDVFEADSLRTLDFIEFGKNLKMIDENSFSRTVKNGSVPVAKELRIFAEGEVDIGDFLYNFVDESQLKKFTFPATPSILRALEKNYINPGYVDDGLDLTIISGSIPSNFGDLAFEKGANVANLVIKEDVSKIEEGAFTRSSRNPAFENIVIEYNPNRVWEGSVSDSSITSLTANASDVKYFSGMQNLYVTGGQIGENAFDDGSCLTSVKTLRLGQSVTVVDASALLKSSSRQTITVDAGNSKYHVDDSQTCLIDDANTLVLGCKTTTTIPSEVTKIGIQAFANTETTLTVIPEGVTTIYSNAFEGCAMRSISLPASLNDMSTSNLSFFAFLNCRKLGSITVDPSNRNYSSQNGLLYNKDKSQLIYVPCNATNIRIADTVSTLTSKAFQDLRNSYGTYSNKISITLGKGVTKIERDVLSDRVFERINLPEEFYNTTWKYGNMPGERYEIKYNGEGEVTNVQITEALTAAATFFLNNSTKTFELVVE